MSVDSVEIVASHKICVINTNSDDEKKLVQDVLSLVDKEENVTQESLDETHLNTDSAYDIIIVQSHDISTSLYSHLFARIKPDATLILRLIDKSTVNTLKSNLVLCGFVGVREVPDADSPDLVSIVVKRPAYEVGSSMKLNLRPKASNNVATVWTLNSDDLTENDLIDDDLLLDADDLIKPDPKELIATCGPEGKKKKACKNCTCGLQEELDQGGEVKVKSVESASSCGNCYLGDAFRCAGCPYSGLPAFKPGDKVQLNAQLLTADV